jgi:hypothetical protein
METNLVLGREVEGIAMTLYNCSNFTDALTAIEVLKSVVRFLDPRPKNPDRTLAHPEKTRIEKSGSIMVPLDITHSLLARDAASLGLGWKLGVAGFTYEAKNNSVRFRQTNSPDGETIEEMVEGLVRLTEIVAPAIGPTYGTVDIASGKLMPRRVRTFRDIKYWCYANLFSKDLVNKAPEGFFDGCPIAEAKLLSDDSLLLKSSDSFTDWYFSPPKRIAKYLATHAPHISIFRQSPEPEF